mmetsp:Transcript_32089/g.85616  ORF Transcript_32089/g.85616 Transcript_32089/m.85616 type:complete len:83 (+) Transcript_32089:174-422(+)
MLTFDPSGIQILKANSLISDSWQDEMAYNENGHSDYYGVPYITNDPKDIVDELKCFPFCDNQQTIEGSDEMRRKKRIMPSSS